MRGIPNLPRRFPTLQGEAERAAAAVEFSVRHGGGGGINDLNLPMLTNAQTAGQVQVLQQIAPRVNNLLTAEKIYAYLRMNPPSETEFARLKRLFSPDNHALWYAPCARCYGGGTSNGG